MRKILLLTTLAAAFAGAAVAQTTAPPAPPPAHHGLFEMDANHDGALTRQEFDAGRSAHFARLDANHDGSVSREERRAERGMRHHRGRGGPGGHPMHNPDANNDGNISRDEFLAGPIEHFNRMDANHNGMIEASERPQHRQGGPGQPGSPGAENGPRRVNPDTNNDGALSQSEFSGMGAQMFDRLDANHDGRVTQAEAQAVAPRARQPR